MKRLLWILFISSICMFGCSPDKKPDGSIKDAQESTWTKSVAELSIFSKDTGNGTRAIIDKFCWEREEKDDCDLSPSDPKLVTEEGLGSAPLFVKTGEFLYLSYTNFTHQIPLPDEYVVTQYGVNDDVGMTMEVTGDQYNPEIQMPDEPGRYYYTVHIQWHEEAVGEVYYAFFLNVREDS